MVSRLETRIGQLCPSLEGHVLRQGLRCFERMQGQGPHGLLRAGQLCERLYFIEKGLVKCHWDTPDGKERVFWIEVEGAFFTDPNGFIGQQPARYHLTLTEPYELYYISRQALNQLYQTHHAWAIWGTRFLESEYLKLLLLYELIFHHDATQKYEQVLRWMPKLLERASLGNIASMLGISQVSLSRIRAGTQLK